MVIIPSYRKTESLGSLGKDPDVTPMSKLWQSYPSDGMSHQKKHRIP